jgi:hypothetical protein
MAPRITSAAPSAAAAVGAPYSHAFAATGWPTPTFSLAAGSLPPGLALSGDGLLSGTPTTAGEYQGIAVQAGNGLAPEAIQAFDIAVAKATPSLSWAAPAAIVYGTPLGAAQLSATADVSGTFSYTPSSGIVLGAGSGQTLTAAFIPGDNLNYATATLSVTLDISRAVLTITAENQTRAYGAATPPLTVRYSGFVNGDTLAGAVAGSPACTTSAQPASSAGTYPIECSAGTLSAANYSFHFVAGALRVTGGPSYSIYMPLMRGTDG